MKGPLIALLLCALPLAGCSTALVVNSRPEGATVYWNERPEGRTPCTFDVPVGMEGDTSLLRLELEGHELHAVRLKRVELHGPVFFPCLIAGAVLLVPLVGLAWGWRYPAAIFVELEKS